MKALVGVDGSSNSFAAVEFIGRLLSPERDALVLAFATPALSLDDDSFDPAIEKRARSALSRTVFDAAIERLPAAWQQRAKTCETSGPASARVFQAIDAEKAELVVVGFRGTSGILEEVMLGSVSRAVVHSATIPSLVVKSGRAGDAPAKQSPGPITQHLRVLVAFDDPEFAARTAALLKRFSWPQETRGWVMTVVRPMFLTDVPDWVKLKRDPDVAAMAAAWETEHQQNLQEARSELEKLRAMLPGCFSKEEPIIAEGRPAEEILAQVREKEIDLVVLGSISSGPWKRVLLGSTSDQVLRESPCSALIVR